MMDHLKGVEIGVCCPPATPLEAELVRRGSKVFATFIADLHRQNRLRRLLAAFRTLGACLKFRPDVIYLNQAGCYRVALPAAWLLRLPIIAHVRIFEDASYLARRSPKKKRLAGLIAISAAVAEAIRSDAALATIPLHILYDAYAPTSLAPVERQQRNASRIACVGRLVPIKGQDVLAKAMPLLEKDGRVEILMAGDGDKDFIDRIRMPDSDPIHWLGFVPDSVKLLETCALLVCPSHREPLGRIIFEAWDAGAVPIAFAGSGGAAEIISACDGGILYDPQSPDALASALARALVMDTASAQRLVENGRNWMARHCDANAYGRSMAEIFARAAG